MNCMCLKRRGKGFFKEEKDFRPGPGRKGRESWRLVREGKKRKRRLVSRKGEGRKGMAVK